MAMYFEGYQKAREAVEAMSHDERLKYIDSLYGREKIEDESNEGDVRYEVLDQCCREFTDTSSKEYGDVQFWVGLHNLSKRTRFI